MTTQAESHAQGDPVGELARIRSDGTPAGVLPDLPLLLDGSRKYVYGAAGLAYDVDGAGTLEVFHTDGLGSVRGISDGTGSIVQTYQTDEFGVLTLTQGTSAQPFGFTGEQRDPEDGLVYLRARMYDPTAGRFLQRDPFSSNLRNPPTQNRYSYALNNPVTLVARRDGTQTNPTFFTKDHCLVTVGKIGSKLTSCAR